MAIVGYQSNKNVITPIVLYIYKVNKTTEI